MEATWCCNLLIGSIQSSHSVKPHSELKDFVLGLSLCFGRSVWVLVDVSVGVCQCVLVSWSVGVGWLVDWLLSCCVSRWMCQQVGLWLGRWLGQSVDGLVCVSGSVRWSMGRSDILNKTDP